MDTKLEYPKVLRTKEDYEFVIDNFDPEIWLPDVQSLIANSVKVEPIGICTKYSYVNGDFVPKDYEIFNDHDECKLGIYKKLIEEAESETVYTFKEIPHEIRYYGNVSGRELYLLVGYKLSKDSKLVRIGFDLKYLLELTLEMSIIVDQKKSEMAKLAEITEHMENKVMEAEEDGRREEN